MGWTIDDVHSSVGFVARHMGLSKVRGQFTAFRGEVEGDPSDITTAKARFEIDTASIDTGNGDRDGHLKSPDFLDVQNYPTMTFVSKSIEADGDDYKVSGDLTIKDQTHPVELRYEHGGDVQDPFGNRKIGGSLSGTIKRSEWGLTWNVPLDSGGWLVSDNVNLEIDLQVAEAKEVVEQEVTREEAIAG
ncbi:MAG: YceI family protein [Actinomycetota bacterium]|nr:YceI family protein [Actinomycetota bacterium]